VALIFSLGIALVLVAPLLRRFGKASQTLAAGAFIMLAVVVVGLAFPNTAAGLEAVESDRRFYLAILGFELPVLTLGLISLRFFRYTFWIGWAINLILTLLLIALMVWLKFFWHW
jgi:hypothetical protein